MGAAPPATSRHMSRSLWLLPSGPDQVHDVSLREDQQSYHNAVSRCSVTELARSIPACFFIAKQSRYFYEEFLPAPRNMADLTQRCMGS